MSRLQENLAAGKFVVTAEIAPPKGADIDPAIEQAKTLADLAAINVTDNQGANMRMSPLVLSGLMCQAGLEPILQLTCRDRNRLALQSDLLGAAALGVENLLLLSGDRDMLDRITPPVSPTSPAVRFADVQLSELQPRH